MLTSSQGPKKTVLTLVNCSDKYRQMNAISTPTSVIAMAEKRNSRNTLTLFDYGVSKGGEESCGACSEGSHWAKSYQDPSVPVIENDKASLLI